MLVFMPKGGGRVSLVRRGRKGYGLYPTLGRVMDGTMHTCIAKAY